MAFDVSSLVNFHQIRALLWKDYLVRIRQPWMTTVQFVWPALLFFSLYALRLRFTSTEIDACQFPTRQLPSRSDVLPFFQSYICTIDNQCMPPELYEETSSFLNAPVTPLLHIVQTFLNEPALLGAVTDLPTSGNFLGAVTKVATHPKFGHIREQIDAFSVRYPDYAQKIGGAFEIEKLWFDDDTFSKFGNILCGKPFPRSNNIRFVERAFQHDDYNGPDRAELDAMPTPYCKQLYLDVTNTNHGKITWNQIKPIIQGRVLYGPDTEQTREIMSHANGTFEGISRLKTFLTSLATVVTKLRSDDAYRSKLGSLVDIIKTPLVASLIGQANIDPTMLDGILDSLLNDVALLSVLKTVSGIMDCFNVDRFEAVKDNEELERRALQMNERRLFYAAVLFNGTGNWSGMGDEKEVAYTLRMDIDNTPKTIENKNKFWFPGPEASFTDDMRYHRGFIEWQHAIDTGIIKMFKSGRRKVTGEGSAEKLKKVSTPSDENLSFSEDFFNDDFDDEQSSTESTQTNATSSGSDEPEEYPDTTNDPEVEAYLDFHGIEKHKHLLEHHGADVEPYLDFHGLEKHKHLLEQHLHHNRSKRQFEGLLGSLFGSGADTSNEAPEETFDIDQLKVFTKMFPYPRYVHDEFKKGLYLANAVQVAFFFALLVQIAAAVRQRLWTKESGNRKLMQCMGLWQSSDLIAWSVTTLVEIAITFLICTVILYTGGVLGSSSKLFLVFFLAMFAFSVLSFCYMTSAFFTKATIGSVSSAIVFLMSFMPYIVIVSTGSTMTLCTKIVMNLSVSTAFCFAWNHITRLELQQHSLDFSEAFGGTLETNDLKFGMLMLCIDTVLYAIVGYLYGRFYTDEYRFVEVAVRDLPANVGAQLRNVTKSYTLRRAGAAVKPALNDATIEFRRDRITCLLGRNGAGKSTIIKLLTGQIEANQGEVYLPQNVNAITGDERKERVGLCPQSTVLIPNMTAKEHLEMYASIKLQSSASGLDGVGGGCSSAELNCEVERVMAGLEFGEYEQFRCENLSGGFKRRLNIGIAFIGSPNLVILDEPCSAVDTKARKAIWQTIKCLRKGRAVIMATHHLDEAETMSDSLVILNEGRLICEHSTQSLRDRFARSLCVRVELPAFGGRSGAGADVVGEIRGQLMELCPDHTIVHGQTDQLDITLPRYRANGEPVNLASLVRLLELRQTQGDIVGFKMTGSNLEGMFNRLVCTGASDNGKSPEDNGKCRIDGVDFEMTNKQSPISLPNSVLESTPKAGGFWHTVEALFRKRLVHFRRNYRLILCVLVLPTVFVAIAMGFMTIRPPGEFDIALPLDRDLYASSTEFYTKQNGGAFDAAVYERLAGRRDNETAVEFGDSAEAFRWLINCSEVGATNRYGGITLNSSTAAVWYNNKGYHSMPAYLNELNNAMLNAEMGTDGQEYRIRTVNRPLKLGMDELSAASVLQKVADAGISIILLVAFSLVIAGSSIYIVNERTSGEKLQQKLAGVGFGTYWGVAVAWDMAVYCVAIVLAVCVILAFDIPAYTARDNLAGIVIMLFMFGFATTPMIHVCEKLFTDASLANMHILCMNIILALTTRTTIILIDLLGESDTSAWIRDNLNRAFFIFPQHALADGLVELCENHILAVVFARYYINTYKSPISTNLLVPHIVSLFVVGVLFAILNYCIESGLFQRWQQRRSAKSLKSASSTATASSPIVNRLADAKPNVEDADGNCVVSVVGLSKRYGQHQALDNVSFRVRRAECFGLLGVNGAGKSTVFSILSGQTYASGGEVRWMDNRGVSYCPQTNALNDLLTVAETIRFYGVLRKVADLEGLTARALHQFHLLPYRDVLAKDLSGGNRRKLSVAVTCFGNTSLVLMDEPTSDMDPVTRHLTYACIRELLAADRSVILTSHTIAEIDRVCGRIAILRRGKLVSMGDTEALQAMYGLCYAVSVFRRVDADGVVEFGGDGRWLEEELRKVVPCMESVVMQPQQRSAEATALDVGKEQGGGGGGGDGLQFVVRIRGDREPDVDDETAEVAGRRPKTALRLSELCEVLHCFAEQHAGVMYTLTECLLDQAFERVLETNQSNYTYANRGFLLNEASPA